MADYERRVKERKANKFNFVYTIDQLYTLLLFFGALSVGYVLISFIAKNNEFFRLLLNWFLKSVI